VTVGKLSVAMRGCLGGGGRIMKVRRGLKGEKNIGISYEDDTV
jgi:hypothetical protein